MWTGSGTAFTSTYLRTYQIGWSLIGTRDVDGDGGSDMQWRNQGNGQFVYWLMDGPVRVSYRVFTMSSSFQSTVLATQWRWRGRDWRKCCRCFPAG